MKPSAATVWATLFRLTARDLLYAPPHRQDSTNHSLCYTSHRALAGMRNSSIGPPRGIDPVTHCTISGCSTSELHLTPIPPEIDSQFSSIRVANKRLTLLNYTWLSIFLRWISDTPPFLLTYCVSVVKHSLYQLH